MVSSRDRRYTESSPCAKYSYLQYHSQSHAFDAKTATAVLDKKRCRGSAGFFGMCMHENVYKSLFRDRKYPDGCRKFFGQSTGKCHPHQAKAEHAHATKFLADGF